MPEMSDTTLTSICEAKLNNALGWVGGLLSKERTLAMSYYRGDLFGNEQDGRSTVISRDVAEAIDGAMPSLIKVFSAVDTIVSCKPRRKDAEESADQATDYLNYTFLTQPNAFDLLQTWIKDGLMTKLGVVKSWWDESEDISTEEYEGLTAFQYLTLLSDDEVEPISYTVHAEKKPEIDPGAPPAPPPLPTQPPPTANPGALPQTPANNPGMPPSPQQPGAPVPTGAAPPAGPPPLQPAASMQGPMPDDGKLYDCKIKRTKRDGKLCIEAIPPEEFLTDRRAVSADRITFAAHRSIRSVSDLIEMGVPKKVAHELPGGTELDYNTEIIMRFKSEDENPQRQDTDGLDPALRSVWVAECYLKVDYDGDGVAEWRKVTLAGSGGWKILFNEEAEGHPFSMWTPFKQPHKLYGESMADKTMDIQLIKSTVWRANMDGLYFNSAPQLIVQEGQANMEDVLTRRPGGIIRVKNPTAVTPLPVVDGSQSSMQMLGYLDHVRESRTGMRSWAPGLEGNELNPLATTATGVNAVEDATADTLELIARNFAEQGVKPLFKRMLELICKHQDKAQTVRLRGKWVDIDPSTWDTEMDMEVMVGLGTGDKTKQVAQIMSMLTQVDVQVAAAQGGISGPILTAENVYNKLSKLAEAMGFKTSDNFYTDPATQPPQTPKPDPKAQAEQAKQATNAQNHQLSVQADAAKSQQRVQADITIKTMTARLDQEKAERDAQLKEWMAQQDHERQQVQTQQKMMHADQQHKLDAMATIMQGIHDHQKHQANMAVLETKRHVLTTKPKEPA